jgi:hypothetical protein
MSTEVMQRPKLKPKKTEREIERGLLALAECNGNSRRAAALLKQDGIVLDHSTLAKWANNGHAQRYEEIRAEVLPKVRRKAADEHRQLAEKANEVNALILDRLKAKVEDLPPKELSGAARNMSVSSAVHTEKSELLDGLPTEIRSDGKDAASVLRKLSGRGLRFEATERERKVVVEASDG